MVLLIVRPSSPLVSTGQTADEKPAEESFYTTSEREKNIFSSEREREERALSIWPHPLFPRLSLKAARRFVERPWDRPTLSFFFGDEPFFAPIKRLFFIVEVRIAQGFKFYLWGPCVKRVGQQ